MWHLPELLNYANLCFGKKFLEAGIKISELVIQSYPNCDEAYYLLAQIYLEQKKIREAYINILNALEIQPDNSEYKRQKDYIIVQMQRIGVSLETGSTAADIYDGIGDDVDGFIDFSAIEMAIKLPNRPGLVTQKIYQLGITVDDYEDSISNFLKQHSLQGSYFSIYSTSKSEIEALRKIKTGKLGSQIEWLVLNEHIWERKFGIDFQQIQRLYTSKSKVLFIHLSENEALQDVLKYFILYTRIFSVEGQIFGDAKIVLLNNRIEENEPAASLNPNSLGFVAATNSGRDRFLPGLYHLAAKMDRPVKSNKLYINSPSRPDRIFHEKARKTGRSTLEELREYSETMMFNGEKFLRQLNFFDVGIMHQHFPISKITQIPYLDCIALMRDPRDVTTSVGFSSVWPRPNPESESSETSGKASFENAMLTYINERLESLCNHFVEAQMEPDCYVLRFEDLNKNAFEVFTQVLKWLAWTHKIKADDISEAIYLGTFEHQSGGKRQRGKFEGTTFGPYGDLRKGSVGDWNNHMSPEIKDLIKEKVGGQLIELNYAEDLNW